MTTSTFDTAKGTSKIVNVIRTLDFMIESRHGYDVDGKWVSEMVNENGYVLSFYGETPVTEDPNEDTKLKTSLSSIGGESWSMTTGHKGHTYHIDHTTQIHIASGDKGTIIFSEKDETGHVFAKNEKPYIVDGVKAGNNDIHTDLLSKIC